MKKLISLLFLFILVLSGLGCGSKQEPKSPDAWKHEDNWSMAYIMMEEYVKQRLKSPSTADFPGVFDGMKDHVKSLGNQKYRIISYVDAQNSFGAKIRTAFIGEIQQVGEENWQLLSLELVE